MGGRHSQRPGPSPTLDSLGPSHLWRHKSRVSLLGPPCAYGVVGIPHGEVRDTCFIKCTCHCVDAHYHIQVLIQSIPRVYNII